MSKSEETRAAPRRAAALKFGPNHAAPVIVASGMGYMAEKIVEAAADSGVPIYEDNSLATMLTQLRLGQEIPPELYQAIVDIYVYFLHFDPNAPEQDPLAAARAQMEAAAQSAEGSVNPEDFAPLNFEEV